MLSELRLLGYEAAPRRPYRLTRLSRLPLKVNLMVAREEADRDSRTMRPLDMMV